MDRARRAGIAALCLLLAAAALTAASPPTHRVVAIAPAAAVTWPPSTGLLIAEVVTGGASASDEYVELTNAGAAPADLAGLEVVYVTSSGSTVTRKASWAARLVLAPGQHLLVANVSGIFAPGADATYSGGFAATGGALVLRPTGGTPIDAVGWGDATNAFVEGSAATAPPAGSSIERKPGGPGGNVVDTNANGSDFAVLAAPVPQNLGAPAVPGPSTSPSPSVVPTPSASPAPSVEPSPSTEPSPSPEPSQNPSPSPEPSPSLEPSADPSPEPTPLPSPSLEASPSPSLEPSPSPDPVPSTEPPPSPVASPSPSPAPSAVPVPIADVRTLPLGTWVLVEGTLTTALGALESQRSGFVQDATAGIGIYLDAAANAGPPAGTLVRVTGTLDQRYGQLTLRAGASGVVPIASAPLPEPIAASTGLVAEALEGRRVTVTGTVTEAPTSLADGTGILLDDGSGPIRVIASADALGGLVPKTGSVFVATGPVGQRDSSGTGVAGYRIHATLPGELLAPAPSPEPSPSVSPSPQPSPTLDPSPSPSPSPSPTVLPSPSPSASPSPSPWPSPSSAAVTPLVAVRRLPVGTLVTTEAVVAAEPGRLGSPADFAVTTAEAGIAVKAADGMTVPPRGRLVRLTGALAQPYGQLELRLVAGGLVDRGPAAIPAPLAVRAADLGEETEGRIVTVEGRLAARPARGTSGDLSLNFDDGSGTGFRVFADASAGLGPDGFTVGSTYRLTGIAGQRASRKGALDGYRVWLRDAADVLRLAGPTPSGAASPAPSPSSNGGAGATATVPIGTAAIRTGQTLAVAGVVTAPATLLDSSGRRIVVEDPSGAIELLLPSGATAPRVGSHVRAAGTVTRAYGAPRLRVTELAVLGTGVHRPRVLRGAPGPAHEWRLVSVAGRVVEVRRLGDRWRAELLVGTDRVVIAGLAGAGIPVTRLVEGRQAEVVGIVRRPYPNASDRRFAVTPRSVADVIIGTAGAASGATGTSTRPEAPGAAGETGQPASAAGTTVDADLMDLARHTGGAVRVGGLIVELTPDGFTLDDGTATGRVELRGEAAAYGPLLEPGDAVNAIGTVEGTGSEARVVVSDPAGLIRVGDPGEGLAEPSDGPDAATGPVASNAASAGRRSATLGVPFDLDGGGTTSLISVVLLTLASLGLTLIRRERARRRLGRRVAARLAAIVGPAATGDSSVTSATTGPSRA